MSRFGPLVGSLLIVAVIRMQEVRFDCQYSLETCAPELLNELGIVYHTIPDRST